LTDFLFFHDEATPEHLGFWPMIFLADDPRPAAEQINDRYAHGGGWNPLKGFTMTEKMELCFPGDPTLKPFAGCSLPLTKETLFFYPYSQVAIVQEDGNFEAGRMD
jgi:hypothetical protein